MTMEELQEEWIRTIKPARILYENSRSEKDYIYLIDTINHFLIDHTVFNMNYLAESE